MASVNHQRSVKGPKGSRNHGQQEEGEDFTEYGLYKTEVEEAVQLFRQRIEARAEASPGEAGRKEQITIEDVDWVTRRMRLFFSMQWTWALFMEGDQNMDGFIDQHEFLLMASKLKKRRPLSRNFYLRTLPRAVKKQFQTVFKILDADADGLLDEDDLITGFKQLNPSIDTDSEEFSAALNTLTGAERSTFNLEDFMVLQAQLRPPPIQVDAAILSLTNEEYKMFERVYNEWREAGMPTSAHEFRHVLAQLGLTASVDKINETLDHLDLESCKDLNKEQFLYILVISGAGSTCGSRPMLRPGASYEDAFKTGCPLEELWELGYDELAEIRKAGWSAQSVWKAGMAEAHQLRQVGYSAGELRKTGMSARELKLAGFSLEELRNAGFGSAVLRDCSASFSKLQAVAGGDAGLVLYPLDENVPTTAGTIKSASTFSKTDYDTRWWTTPRIQSMLDGPHPIGGGPLDPRPSTAP